MTHICMPVLASTANTSTHKHKLAHTWFKSRRPTSTSTKGGMEEPNAWYSTARLRIQGCGKLGYSAPSSSSSSFYAITLVLYYGIIIVPFGIIQYAVQCANTIGSFTAPLRGAPARCIVSHVHSLAQTPADRTHLIMRIQPPFLTPGATSSLTSLMGTRTCACVCMHVCMCVCVCARARVCVWHALSVSDACRCVRTRRVHVRAEVHSTLLACTLVVLYIHHQKHMYTITTHVHDHTH